MGRAIRWTLLTILAFFCVEAAVFRSGWYIGYIEPSSAAGTVEYQLYFLKHKPHPAVPEVLVIGDSRMAEGFSAVRADAEVQDRLHFWNLGIGGATPRDWYYIVRDADPTRRRFAAIVLPMDDYSDEERSPDLRDSIADLSYTTGLLRLSDCWDFAMSMHSTENRHAALAGCLFKGVTLRRDVQELLRNIPTRLHDVALNQKDGLNWLNAYGGKQETLAGLTMDANRTVHFPPGLSEAQQDLLMARLNPNVPPDAGIVTAYRKRWLGRILDLYRDSPTQVLLFQLPRSPLPSHPSSVPPRFIQSVIGRPRVTVMPANHFTDLERPAIFADALHLNHEGRILFSDRLADDTLALLRQAHE